MPAPVIQSVTPTTQSTATTVSAAPPASIANGDLMLALYSTQDATSTSATHTKPTGWDDWLSQLGWARNRLSSIYKIASGESGNYTFTASATLDHLVAILRITGQAASGYLHQAAADGDGEAARTTFVCPEVTTTLNDCLILYCVNWSGNVAPLTTPSGCSSVHEGGFTGETQQRLMIFSKTLATAGPSGTGTYTTNTVRDGTAMTLAIAPAAASFKSAWARNSNQILGQAV